MSVQKSKCSLSDCHQHSFKLETSTIDIAKQLQASVSVNSNTLSALQESNNPNNNDKVNEEIDPNSVSFTPQAKASTFYTLPIEQFQGPHKDKPWRKDPHYFKTVHISLQAFLKMTIHARQGGQLEIMGMLMGITKGSDMIILDCYPLPVHGTESRVNPLNDAYPFMLSYLSKQQEFPYRKENIIGWYHSHPGFGCWLSGIDVETQSMNQGFQDPYVALVVDPEKSIRQGFVEIGAFRTYYTDNMPKSTDSKKNLGNVSGISSKKLQDFGHHADKYYSLGVKIFKSESDEKILNLLDSKFWYSGVVDTKQEDEILKIDRIDKLAYKVQNKNTLSVRRIAAENSNASNKKSPGSSKFVTDQRMAMDQHKMMRFNRQVAELSPVLAAQGSSLYYGGVGDSPYSSGSRAGNTSVGTSNANVGGALKARTSNLKISQDINLLGSEELKSYLLREIQEELFL